MKLKKLIQNIEGVSVKGSKDIKITGICDDSRIVSPGNLFIAKKGEAFDGTDFILNATKAGAVAIAADTYNPFLKDVSQIICKDISRFEKDIASIYYQNPSKELFTVGITGTNGKTTIGYLLFHLLKDSGLLGTVEYITGPHRIFSSLTTPSNLNLQKYLKEMVLSNKKVAILEVSSHGICQKRIQNIDFDVGIFTNLTSEHLDYHKTMKQYAFSKKKFFDSLKPSSLAVLNKDSAYYDFMKKDICCEEFSYSINKPSDLMARNISMKQNKSFFDVIFQGKKEHFETFLIGKFNIYNILAAISVCLKYGYSLNEIKKSLEKISFIQGRLERIENDKELFIYVDYAHTEDGLKNVLQTLQDIKEKRIITVFGCGGNRDKEKRPLMGKVCSRYSDYSIITSDNPRDEDVSGIIEQIEKGFLKNNYEIEEDRYTAIKKAIWMAEKKDIILIAGKGHEAKQVFANNTVFFDDRKVVKEILLEI